MPTHRQHAPPAAEAGWAYFLDVDGTLVDIAATPEAIRVDAALPGLLQQLHHASGGALALISGRPLADLDRRLGGLRLTLAGQHGLERRDAAGRLWLHRTAPGAQQRLREGLAPLLKRHPGLLLEDKGLSLALHYRQAPRLAPQVHRVMARLLAEAGHGLQLQKGKHVVEIRPACADKGTAIAAYLGEPPFRDKCPVFIGDDFNDEHGFAVVNLAQGVSIKVGPGRTCARYRLSDVAAVHAWLSGVKTLASGQ